MLGKRSRPSTIGKLAGALRSAGVVDSSTSPRSPLDCRMQSPRGPKNYDQQGGVGLGIVVSLDKSSSNTNNNNIITTSNELLAKYGICGQFSCRSIPIPTKNSSSGNYTHNYRNNHNNNHMNYECDYNHKGEDDVMEEEYTYVTCHGPNKSVTTKVYYEGGEYGHVTGRRINQNVGVFNISSPASFFEDRRCTSDTDFLSSCQLCKKTLHGKDIYMYRGEKAFCSAECRQRQIRVDERKEQCRSEASRSGNVSSSYTNSNSRGDQIFSAGIIAV